MFNNSLKGSLNFVPIEVDLFVNLYINMKINDNWQNIYQCLLSLKCDFCVVHQSSRMYCTMFHVDTQKHTCCHIALSCVYFQPANNSQLSLMVLPRFQENHQVKSFYGCEYIGSVRGRPCWIEFLRLSMSWGINNILFLNFFIFLGPSEDTGYH